MTTTVLASRPGELEPARLGSIRRSVFVILAVWFLLVVTLGASGAFVGRPGTPPLAMGIGFAAPLVLFFLWLQLSQSFRTFILSIDLRLIAAAQAWRWAGIGFLSLYAHKVLPALFALPAGLGDMAIGIAAPWIVLALVRDPSFAARPAFTRWNVLGILDLVVAVSIGTLISALSTGAPAEVSTGAMATMPLVLIPAFMVPLFLMLHTSALMQARRVTRS